MSENKKKKSKILSVLKWLGLGLLFLLLFIIISLFAINEIEFIRKPFLKFATNIANNALLAKVSLEDLKFTSFNSIEIKQVKLLADGDTLANIENIKVKIEISPILQSQFIVRNIEIHNGTIKLLRNKYDSLWNFEKIAPPSNTVSQPSSTQPIIDVRKLDFTNITFVFKDSTASDTSARFNPLDIYAKNLNINLSAYANLNTNKMRGKINNISFDEQNYNFKLNALSIFFQMDSTSVNIEKLHLQTNNSNINIVANVKDFSPLSKEKYTDIKKATFNLNANIDSVNTNDLLTFLELPFNRDQVTNFIIKANGTERELNIEQLNANIGNTKLDLTGKLFHFMSDSIIYSANIANSYATKTDLINLIKADFSSIPDINYVEIKKLIGIGSTHYVNANLDLITNAGSINGDVNFQFDPTYEYSANLNFKELNMQNITYSPDLASNLNGSVFIKGSGLDLNKMIDTLSLIAYNSMIYRNNLDTVIIRGTLNQGIAVFPEISVQFPESNSSYIKLNASTNFRNMKNPSYSIKGVLNNLNLASIAHDKNLPINFTDKFELVGSGIDLDSLQFLFKTEIDELLLENIALMPQKLEMSLKTNGSEEKEFSFESGDNQINAIGEIKINEFVNSMSQSVQFGTLYFEDIYKNFILKKRDTSLARTLSENFKDYKFPFFDLIVSMKIKDFALVNIFMPQLNIVSSINSSIHITSYDNNLMADIDSGQIGFTSIQTNGTKVQVDPFIMDGSIRIQKDSNQITIPQITLNIKDIDALTINQIKIINPEVSLNSNFENFNLNLSAKYDTLLQIRTNINGKFVRDFLDLQIDTLFVTALDQYTWKYSKDLHIKLDASSLDIENFELIRKGKEKISITGKIDTTSFQNLSINIQDVILKDYATFLSKELMQNFNFLEYNHFLLDLNADGQFSNPNYTLKFGIDNIKYEKSYLGNFAGNFAYLDKKLDGNIEIGNNENVMKVPLSIEVPKLPIDLSFNNFGKIYSDFALNIMMDSLQAGYLGLFLPFVSNLSGIINSQIQLYGNNVDDISLDGNLDIDNVKFNLKYNNINYKLNSEIKFDNKLIQIDKLSLENQQYPGSLNLNGEVILSRNNLEYFDFDVNLKNLIILDENSKYANAGAYGKIDISSKNGPITIIGDLESQEVTGSLQINPSNITIVNLSQSNSKAQTSFVYEIKDDKKIYTYTIQEDTLGQDNLKKDSIKIEKKRRLNSNKLNIDVRVYIPQEVNVTLQLGGIGEIKAIIGTSDPTIPLRFVLNPQNPSGQLYGELILEDGSVINSYKVMKASGKISFQTGNLTNPALNITGEYEGKIDDPQNPGKYTAYIRITGTAQSPIVHFDYTINNVAPQGDSTKIEENALYLLLFGYLPGSSYNTGGGLLDPSVVQQLGNMGLSSTASRSFSDLLTKTGVIESADVQLNSQDFNKTRVQLKGRLLGNVNWSLSGNLSDFSRNNQIVIEIPISVNSSVLNQVLAQIAYSTNSSSTTTDPDEKNWEIKLKIGGSW